MPRCGGSAGAILHRSSDLWRHDMQVIVRTAKANDVKVVLMTYPLNERGYKLVAGDVLDFITDHDTLEHAATFDGRR